MALLFEGLREGRAHPPAPHDHDVHYDCPMLRTTALTCTNNLLTTFFPICWPRELPVRGYAAARPVVACAPRRRMPPPYPQRSGERAPGPPTGQVIKDDRK
ncbi:hypothetical protein GCM10010315_13510 [Streptomyces luteosporeus]|uniref:Uncharacterized protein n=1 Tax=Streptomyces luteosporeus TaxID=173856 RepID=A0ABN3TNH9_9ACTN